MYDTGVYGSVSEKMWGLNLTWKYILTFEKSLIFGGQQLEHPDWKRIPILDSEHQETYDLIPHIAYFYWLYILTRGQN